MAMLQAAARPRLTAAQATALLSELEGVRRLLAALLYLTGLGLADALQLRVGSVDLQRQRLRPLHTETPLPLPEPLCAPLAQHLQRLREIHRHDLLRGLGSAALPPRLGPPGALLGRSLQWQFLFPSRKLQIVPGSGLRLRQHLDLATMQTALRQAGVRAGLAADLSGADLAAAAPPAPRHLPLLSALLATGTAAPGPTASPLRLTG